MLDLPPELDAATAELLAAYVAELHRILTELEPWWARLGELHGRRRREHWPAGIASHPRVLAVIADYHRRFAELAAPDATHDPPRFDDDTAWGSERELDPERLVAIPPTRLVIDRLQVEAPELYAKLIYVVVLPLGRGPEPRPSLATLEIVEPERLQIRSFDFPCRHGVQRGLDRLRAAATDLRGGSLPAVDLEAASEFHRHAFHAYLRDLEAALIEAQHEWLRELGLLEARHADFDEALDALYAERRLGAATHPRILGVIQAYWALCEEINTMIGGSVRRVGPECLLLDWLGAEPRRASWLEPLTALPYWPVCRDGDGRWL